METGAGAVEKFVDLHRALAGGGELVGKGALGTDEPVHAGARLETVFPLEGTLGHASASDKIFQRTREPL